MDVMRVIESIATELKALQENLKHEEVSKRMLENMVHQQEQELLFSQNPRYAKGIVEENKRLKEDIEDLTLRLDICKDIIRDMRMIIESVKSEVKPLFMSDHVIELAKQGVSVLRLSQLYGTAKARIINTLKNAGQYKSDGNPKNDNEQGEDEMV